VLNKGNFTLKATKIKRYSATRNSAKGWSGDSKRHSLAARGISTGKFSRRPKSKYSLSELSDFRKQLVDTGATFETSDDTQEIFERSARDTAEGIVSGEDVASDIMTVDEEKPVKSDDEIARTIGKVKSRGERINLVPSVNEIVPRTSTLEEDVYGGV